MEATLLLILGVLAMLRGAYYVVGPLWSAPKQGAWRASTVWTDWLERRDTLLFNLEDIAHEKGLGKLSEEDFKRLETAYRQELAEVLEKIRTGNPPKDFTEFLEKGE